MAAENRPRGLFVTGTDTGVGKTSVGAALCSFLGARGLDVGAMKPVETGVADPSALGEDARLLSWAAGSRDEADLVSPYRFSPPLAPSLAAEKEGAQAVSLPLIQERCRQLGERHDFVVVEGAGGLMVPLAGGLLMADLARELGFPLLVVCRPGLGTINHTLLTIFAARAMEIPLAGFVINGMPAAPNAAEESAPHTLASLASADLLGVLTSVEGDERVRVAALAEQIAGLPTLPWLLMNLGLSGLLP